MTFPATPDGRTYVHLDCGQQTHVDGDDFRGLCDPVGGLLPVRTFCTHCGRLDPVDRFAWADTNESLADYRRRLRSTLSPWYVAKRRLLLLGGLLLVPAALAYGAARLIPTHPIIAGTAGFLVGLLIGLMALGAHLGAAETDFRRYR